MNKDDELSRRVIETWEEKRSPKKLQTISWSAVLMIGMFVAFVPAVVWGCIVTWLAWHVADHWTAVVVGFVVFLLSLWMGGWLALVIQIVPEKWIKGD